MDINPPSLSRSLNPCPEEPGYTVFKNSIDSDQLASEGQSVCEFMSTFRIKYSGSVSIRNGRGILIYSAWDGLKDQIGINIRKTLESLICE